MHFSAEYSKSRSLIWFPNATFSQVEYAWVFAAQETENLQEELKTVLGGKEELEWVKLILGLEEQQEDR